MAVSWYAVLALAVTALGASVTPSGSRLLEWSTCGRVWITIHSPDIRLPDNSRILDSIELNWAFHDCSDRPKQIGLFDEKPTSWNNAISVYPISVEGHIVTNISLGVPLLPGGWDTAVGLKGPQCLWPWVGAGDLKEIQAYNCLKIQPTWMEDNALTINKLRIGDLAIPGTHNAGAWRFDTEISNLGRDSFVLCQDRSIWAQLVHGIRYFDFRIAYYDFYADEDSRYWLNHNLIRIRPLVPLLREIRTFLDSTNEIVIRVLNSAVTHTTLQTQSSTYVSLLHGASSGVLYTTDDAPCDDTKVVFLDAHHFPVGFYEANGTPIRSVHQGLLRIVERELRPHLAFARNFSTGLGSKGPTMQALIDAKKRLLFSYADNSIVNDNNWLWPNLPHLWANTNSASELFMYLDRAISMSPSPTARSPLFSAMAQTTPTVLDILFLRGSLRENADEVNRIVSSRLATLWRFHSNIISSDFFLGNDVVDLSIQVSIDRTLRL